MNGLTARPFFRKPVVLLTCGLAALAGLLLILYLSGVLMPAYDTEKNGTVDYNVTYCTMDGVALEMDLYYPTEAGPWPALVFVHGGSWMEGDKYGVPTTPVAAGFLLASINYRMYPDSRFPAMIEDVKCAIRFLRAHARQYNIDPDRIGVIGHSAGGHLAALAGLADETAGWDAGPYPLQSSRVQAAVVLAGPADLTRPFPDGVAEIIQNVFGPEQLVSGSPVTYAKAGAPPLLIIHGDADAVVPVEQAYLLRDALAAAGAPVELLIVQHAGHGFESVGEPTLPSIEDVYQQAIDFLTRVLK